MAEVAFAIPGDLATPTGGYRYARELLARLPGHGIAPLHLQLPGSFPLAPVGDLSLTQALLQATPPDAVLLIDGLAYGAMTDLVLRSVNRTIVALVHHPLALETGLPERRRRAFAASERDALARATAVVATSAATARVLAADYGVPTERLSVAEPGTAEAPMAVGSGGPGVALLAVGAVSPRKGYGTLLDALAMLSDLPWRRTIAGAIDRAPEEAERLRAAIVAHGLGNRVVLAGAVDDARLQALYAGADVFVHPALFEGYGMVLGEAMARGLPVVASSGGASAETLPDAAGLKVQPGDPTGLAAALRRTITDQDLRTTLAAGSRRAGAALPGWDDTAARIAAVLHKAGA